MKKRYAIVGLSHRAHGMFINAILGTYKDVAEIVAYIDIDPERIDMMNELKETSIPGYTEEQFEGYRLGINGLNGRIEHEAIHSREGQPVPEGLRKDITLIELFGARHTIQPISKPGGHGGGDPLLQDDLFLGRDESEKVVRMAPLEDGVLSVLTGVGVHKSIAEKRPITIRELLEG